MRARRGACVKSKAAQPAASWRSGGVSQRRSTPRAALRLGQPRPTRRLGGAAWPPGPWSLRGEVLRHSAGRDDAVVHAVLLLASGELVERVRVGALHRQQLFATRYAARLGCSSEIVKTSGAERRSTSRHGRAIATVTPRPLLNSVRMSEAGKSRRSRNRSFRLGWHTSAVPASAGWRDRDPNPADGARCPARWSAPRRRR